MKSFRIFKSVTIVCYAFLLLAINSCSSTKELSQNETNKFYSFSPETRVLINFPAHTDNAKPVVLILYALPNGNTIEMSAGKTITKNDDWHFDIQHIAAQTRFVRNTLREYSIVIAYLENSLKSWPAWQKKYKNSAEDIARIIQLIRFETGNPQSVILAAHSGGGSFITGFMNSTDSIPNYISRIAFLDANYSYTDSLEHGKKLLHWLNTDTTHKLCVIAYDDREIMLNGKKVVSSTGGTYRATQQMIQRFTEQTDITLKQDSTIKQYFAFHNRARFIIHSNPDTLILHTVLVEKNGLIHSLLFQTAAEEKDYKFFGKRVYTNFISK
jgi:hypothetical protein